MNAMDTQLIWVDFIILGIIGLSALFSLWRGFIREAFSLAVWILAFWVSWTFFRDLSLHMEAYIQTPSVRLGVAFALLMILSLTLGGLINYLVIRLIKSTGLSGSDRFIGMFFGIARGVVLVSVLVLLAGLTPLPQDPWWNDSVLIPYFQELALWLRDLLPPEVADRFQFLAEEAARSAPVPPVLPPPEMPAVPNPAPPE
ncbi:membrane protein required for colicin V production [Thiolapillus brandeum]|uniref:Membrane protein required for colicin V production n=2 Tax=Thiolapillus brandeum TaxID=1076588 RepID=A0A7U6GIH2_9GAMM|nr:membrane protein required for colicin V production [Thiolapillus brandeum]